MLSVSSRRSAPRTSLGLGLGLGLGSGLGLGLGLVLEVGRLVGGVAERGHAHEAGVVLHVRVGVVADVLATEQRCVIPGERARRRVRGTEGVWEGRARGEVGGGGGGLRLRAFSF